MPKRFHRFVEVINERKISDPNFSMYKDMSDERVQEIYRTIADLYRSGQDQLSVNCWHLRITILRDVADLSQSQKSIALQTTFVRLSESLPEYCMIGKVRYIDYDEELIELGNVLNAITYKRRSFEYLNEKG